MSLLADGLVLLVAALHGYFLVREMFLRRTDRGMKTFGTDPEFVARSATLAADQGLYLRFLAVGLIRGVLVDVLSGAGGPRSVSRR